MLLIVSGRLDLDDGGSRMSVDEPTSLILVEADTRADLLKTPGGTEQCFRSLFLTFSIELLDRFYRGRPAKQGKRPHAEPFRRVPLDEDLTVSLRHAIESLTNSAISDERVRYRLMDLLVALEERGYRFSQINPDSTSARVRTLIGDAPARHWTAQEAGKELAMSAATLRRRLASEHMRFEDLLIDIRMHHAMMLVQTTTWGVARIAEACGYKSRARFAERFQARFGYPPSAVR